MILTFFFNTFYLMGYIIVCYYLQYTQMNSKVGILARKRRQFLRLERATIVRAQGASEDRKFAAKPTRPKTNF